MHQLIPQPIQHHAVSRVSVLLLCLSMSACTTQRTLEEAGEQFSKGDYGWGLYTSTVGVVMSAVVDVATLGGSVSPEEGIGAITNVVSATSNSRSKAPVYTAVAPMLALSNTVTQDTNAPAVDSQLPATPDPVPAYQAPSTARHIDGKCIALKQYGSGVSADVRQLVSSCNVPVQVQFCFYANGVEEQNCRKPGTVGWGVTDTIPPRGRGIVVSRNSGSVGIRYQVCDMTDRSKLCLRVD